MLYQRDVNLSSFDVIKRGAEWASSKVGYLRKLTERAPRLKNEANGDREKLVHLFNGLVHARNLVHADAVKEEKLNFFERLKLNLTQRVLPWKAIVNADKLIEELQTVIWGIDEARIAENIRKGRDAIAARNGGNQIIGLTEEAIKKIATHIVRKLLPNPQNKWHKSSEVGLARSIYQKGKECYLIIGKRLKKADPVIGSPGASKKPKYSIAATAKGQVKVYAGMEYRNDSAALSGQDEINALLELGNQEHTVKFDAITERRRGKRGFGKQGIIMDLFTGPDLWAQRKAIKALTYKEKLNLILTMAKGVRFVHGRGFVHRDIKLENFFINQEDLTKAILADFGLSGKWQPGQYLADTRGTIEYVAPEALKPSMQVDHQKCDVWSLGVAFFALLAGGVPNRGHFHQFRENDIASWCDAHLKDPFFNGLVKDMLKRDPGNRISVADVITRLQEEIAKL